MNKPSLRLVTILLLTLGISPPASAKSLFDNFYFFGDSLSDMGNNATDHAPMTNPGGSTWTQYFSNKFGGQSTPSNNGGNDYAYAGAETGSGLVNNLPNGGVIGQANTYLANNRIDPNALYSVWAGANDIANGLSNNIPPADIITNATNNINSVVQALHNAGAKYIMVLNLPDLSKTPLAAEMAAKYGQEVLAALEALSNGFNQVLTSTLSANGFSVIQLDIYHLLDDVMANPARFGLTNITGECSQDSSCNGTGYLFWDGEHPTTAGHTMIADYAFSVVVGPTRAAILAEAPFSVMDAQNYSVENQLYNVRTDMLNLAIGQTAPFASASYAPSVQSSQGTKSPGFDTNNNNITAGFVRRINNNIAAGAAIAQSNGQISFGQHAGGFNMTENMVSAFASYRYNKFYADEILDYGIINYNNIQRNIPIGASQNVASGQTNGSQFGTDLITGLNIINNALKTGPLVSIDYQHIIVNAYDESGNIAGIAEGFNKQSNDFLSTGIGWQTSYIISANNIQIMPFAQLTYNHQWKDGDRDVGVSLTSLPGSHFTIPVSGPNGNYGIASVGISANLVKNVNLSIGYQTTLFYANVHSQNISMNIQLTI